MRKAGFLLVLSPLLLFLSVGGTNSNPRRGGRSRSSKFFAFRPEPSKNCAQLLPWQSSPSQLLGHVVRTVPYRRCPRSWNGRSSMALGNFQVIGISMDDATPEVITTVSRLKLNYPVLIGDEYLGADYGGVLGLPVTFLIDRDGKIQARYQGDVPNAYQQRYSTPSAITLRRPGGPPVNFDSCGSRKPLQAFA